MPSSGPVIRFEFSIIKHLLFCEEALHILYCVISSPHEAVLKNDSPPFIHRFTILGLCLADLVLFCKICSNPYYNDGAALLAETAAGAATPTNPFYVNEEEEEEDDDDEDDDDSSFYDAEGIYSEIEDVP